MKRGARCSNLFDDLAHTIDGPVSTVGAPEPFVLHQDDTFTEERRIEFAVQSVTKRCYEYSPFIVAAVVSLVALAVFGVAVIDLLL